MRYRDFEYQIDVIPPAPDAAQHLFIARCDGVDQRLPAGGIRRIPLAFVAQGDSDTDARFKLDAEVCRFIDAHP